MSRCGTATSPARDSGDPAWRLLIPEEEVPPEGVILRRSDQAARWHDGRPHPCAETAPSWVGMRRPAG